MAKKATMIVGDWETVPSSWNEENHPIFRGRKSNPANPWPEYPVAGSEMLDRSTKGSPPFTKAEIARGYRKVKG